MRVDLLMNEPLSKKKGSDTSAKNIDSDQPAQSAQADLIRYFLPCVISLHIKGQ